MTEYQRHRETLTSHQQTIANSARGLRKIASEQGGYDREANKRQDLAEALTYALRAIEERDELLEALKQAMGWIDSWSPSFTNDGDWPETEHHIRAAIAKTEGSANVRED